MTATFGKLQGRSLELGDGLNIIEAPNETGKSTWCAFLLSILYGVNSRERDRAGFIADKNRFAPWSGAAMSGRMDCGTELGGVDSDPRHPAADQPHGGIQCRIRRYQRACAGPDRCRLRRDPAGHQPGGL
ncbi:MAG: AAA family ATPase [Dysosmobacter sp.]